MSDTGIMDREPAVVISTASAFLTAILGCAAAFGFGLSDEQRNAVLGAVAPLVALLFLVGPIIRSFVYAPRSVQQKVDEAASKGANNETQTPVVT